MEEREGGQEVRWKRSNLTAGEYSSLQRSHKGLTQPLNTRHVSRCATQRHTHKKPLKRSLFVSVTLTDTHIYCAHSTPQSASAHSLSLYIKMMTVGVLHLAISPCSLPAGNVHEAEFKCRTFDAGTLVPLVDRGHNKWCKLSYQTRCGTILGLQSADIGLLQIYQYLCICRPIGNN